MDNFENTKPELQEEEEVDALWISEDVRSFIYDMAKWTKFLSIVGFVFSVMIVFTAFSASAVVSTIAAVNPGSPLVQLGAPMLTVIYMVVALLQFYPSFLLYKFSTAAMQAVLFVDQESLGVAMSKLKSFFKFWGVMTIIFIGLYILTMAVFITSGGAAA